MTPTSASSPETTPRPSSRAERLARGALFKAARDYAHRFLRWLRIPASDRADLAQEALAAASFRCSDYQPERGSPATWFRGFLLRVVSNYRRRRKRYLRLLREGVPGEPSFTPGPDEGSSALDELPRILHEELLPKVPSKQRAIVIAHDLDGQEMTAIAEQEEISLSTAYRRRELGLAALGEVHTSWRARQKNRGVFFVPVGFMQLFGAVRAFLRRPWVKATLTHGLCAVLGAALYGALRGREAPAPIDPRPPVLLAASEVDASKVDVGAAPGSTDVVDAGGAVDEARAPSIMPSAATPKAVASIARRSAAPKAEDSLEEEHLFDVARSAFDRGDFGGALAALEVHERRFPKGSLASNRELLRIKALVKAGRVPEARARLDRLRGSSAGRALAERLEAFVPSNAASTEPSR